MTSFFQIFTVLISNYVNSNCFIFNLFSYFVLIAWQHTVPFFIQITENMFTFLHATIFACRIPAPALWIFLKDLSVFKITEKCSIYYYFLFRMYCVVTRFSLRLSCDQNFGNMFAWLSYSYSGLQWVSYVAFPICLFESNW